MMTPRPSPTWSPWSPLRFSSSSGRVNIQEQLVTTLHSDCKMCICVLEFYRRLDTMLCTDAEINGAISISYNFTTQKNVIRNEKIIHGLSGTGLCCPVRATGRRIKYLRRNGAKCNMHISSIYIRNRRTAIKAQQQMETIRHVMTVNFHCTGIGITADEVSARYLRAGGAMALLCGKVDMNLIQILGRWHSDAMIRYLHMQVPNHCPTFRG
jgi:hypothetical protein